MTKADIITETAEYYNSTNRAYYDGNCEYIDNKGRRCAAGRCIKDDRIEFFQMENEGIGLCTTNIDQFLKILKPEYEGHNNSNFWQDLQTFHDLNCNWNDQGLTDQGQTEYIRLL